MHTHVADDLWAENGTGALSGVDSDSDVPNLVDNDSSSESDDECCNVSFSAGAEVALSSIAVDVGGCVNGNDLLDCDTSFSAVDISSFNDGLSDISEHAQVTVDAAVNISSLIDGISESTIPVVSSNAKDEVKVIYANIRGLRQGAAQLRHRVATFDPMFVVLTETHLDGDSLDAEMLPPGYRVFARKDRTKHGGGVLILGLEMLLVNDLKLDKYHAPCVSEIVGVEYQDFYIFGAYTQSHLTAPMLFDSLCQIRESSEFAEKTSIFLMDANAHSEEWLGSKVTDNAGECAQAFSEIYGIHQWIDFPTHIKGNILDLVYSDCECKATALPRMGTSDHFTLQLTVDLSLDVPVPPPDRTVYHWSSAPWNHIRGHLRRNFDGWDTHNYGSVEEAVAAFYAIVDSIIKLHVKSSVPRNARPVPWWDRHCTIAQKAVDAAFSKLGYDHDICKKAEKVLKTRQRQAYAKYRKGLREKLAEDNSNKEWWNIVKLHMGKNGSRKAGAPSVDALAEHFAKKLSLDGEENDPVPDFQPVIRGKLSSFRVTLGRVDKVLKSLNPSKSSNGISNRF
jgi:hypothetical protein